MFYLEIFSTEISCLKMIFMATLMHYFLFIVLVKHYDQKLCRDQRADFGLRFQRKKVCRAEGGKETCGWS